MRHLVTGGSGFVGRTLARRLCAAGHQVRILDTRDDFQRPSPIEFVRGSVTDQAAVTTAMEGIDVVHHHAAVVAQAAGSSDCWKTNVEGSRIIAEAARRAAVSTFVHISSTSVFGIPPDGPIDDLTAMHPFEPYGRSKLAAERIIAGICADCGIALTIVRPRVTIGPGRLGIFDLLFDWIARDRTVFVSGSGNAPLQLLHVDDLVAFIMLVLERGPPGTYNVGAFEFGTLQSDLERLIGHAGSCSTIAHVPPVLTRAGGAFLYHFGLIPIGPWHYCTYHRPCVFDTQPLRALGWRPAYSNARMLCEAFDWHRSISPGALEADPSPHRAPLRRGALALLDLFA